VALTPDERRYTARLALAGALGCAAGVLIVGVFDWDRQASLLRLNHHRNRAELIRLHDQIDVGMSAAQASQVLERFRSSHLRLDHARPEASPWYISTPLEIGATNWTLDVQFSDGRISATRVRTEDGEHRRPTGAPPDRGVWRSADR
jgi:hypothetical protein